MVIALAGQMASQSLQAIHLVGELGGGGVVVGGLVGGEEEGGGRGVRGEDWFFNKKYYTIPKIFQLKLLSFTQHASLNDPLLRIHPLSPSIILHIPSLFTISLSPSQP